MKKEYVAPKMEISSFRTEDIMDLSQIFSSFTTEKDNEGNWKSEWNA